MLKHQVWLTMYVKNPKNLIGLICPSKRSVDLVCPSCLAFWESSWLIWQCGRRKLLTFGAKQSLCPSQTGVPDKLCVCPGRPSGLEFEKDTWRETPPPPTGGTSSQKNSPYHHSRKESKISGHKNIKYGIKKIKLN